MKTLRKSGEFLLLFLVVTLVITSSLYFINISINRLNLVVFFLVSSIIYYLFNKNDKSIIKVLLLSLFVIIISIFISCFMFDRSSDGNTYHKDAVGVMKEGFNPVLEESKDFITKRDKNNKLTDYTIWIDHYAKANWMIEANFYSLTSNIESAKAFNLLSIYIVFSLIFTNLINVLDKKKSLLLSLLVVINPVTASQMFTFYNDQLVLLYLFLAIFYLIKLDKDIKDKKSWLIYGASFIILFNMKFNGMGYLLVFSFLFALRFLYKAYKKKEFKKVFNSLFFKYLVLFTVAIFIVGFGTYVKNYLDHNNIFFPLYDSKGEDIITEQEPKKFVKANNLYKLFYGTFSKSNNLRDNDDTILKIPFTIYQDEIKPSLSVDLRIGGFGVFFSGLLIISIFVLVYYYKIYKDDNFILYTLGITILLLLVMEESWWARYTPHFYLFILFSLYILLKNSKNKIFKNIFIVLVTVNTLIPFIGNTYYTFINSIDINNKLNRLDNILIKDTSYNGVLYNLKDYNVIYKFDNKIKSKKLYYKYLDYKEVKDE